MRAIVVATASMLLFPLGMGTARAEDRDVLLSYELHVVPLDAGYQVIAVCNASADPDGIEDQPVATVVTCSVGGVERNQGMPGRESFVVVSPTVTGFPVTVCISGQAGFVNPLTDDLEVVSKGPVCEQVQA
jgi:hypothetical protein